VDAFELGAMVTDIRWIKETVAEIKKTLEADEVSRMHDRHECQMHFETQLEKLSTRIAVVELASGLNKTKLGGIITGVSIVVSAIMAFIAHAIAGAIK